MNEKVPIEWKGWMKRCLLNENISIGRKCVYWIKMCLLKSYNPLGIHSGWYSFGNLFSTSSLSSFLEIQENYESSAKLLFVNFFFFFGQIVKRSRNQATLTLATIILNNFFTW